MSNNKPLTDDYVAGLLAQDARDCSLKYSAMGMEAFRKIDKPSTVPKPNIRFLRHIIKDTDIHNKALLAKEAAESKVRLKDLERNEQSKRRRLNPNARDIRTRQMGNIQAILGEGRVHSRDGRSREHSRGRDDRVSADNDRRGKQSREKHGDKARRDDGSRRHRRVSERNDDPGRREARHGKRTRSRSKDRYSSGEDEAMGKYSRSKRDRSRSPRRRRSSLSGKDRRRRRHRSPRRNQPDSSSLKRGKEQSPPLDEDSDPLNESIGPPPPPRLRGRGTIGGALALDRRFSESYDPKADVQEDDETDPWDETVVSFRDWQKLRLNQDQRMRDSGFITKEQIQRAKGADDKEEPNLVWAKAGERREWDRGKDDDEDDEGVHHKQSTLFSEDF